MVSFKRTPGWKLIFYTVQQEFKTEMWNINKTLHKIFIAKYIQFKLHNKSYTSYFYKSINRFLSGFT